MNDLTQPLRQSGPERRCQKIDAYLFGLAEKCAMNKADHAAGVVAMLSEINGGRRADCLTEVANITAEAGEICMASRKCNFFSRYQD
jgi:hypothetical protein